MKQATEPTNTIAKDPLEQLFDGVAFRNGGKAEAIRRVRTFTAERERRAIVQTMELEGKRRTELQERLNHAESCSIRLQRAIRQINEHRSDEIIDSIERPVYVNETTEQIAKVARG